MVPWHEAVSKFQPVLRDISVVVPATVTFSQLQEAVEKAAQTDVRLKAFESLCLFDLYHMAAEEGQEAKASMAFHLVLQPTEETFSGDDADAALKAAIEALEAAGATLRQ